MVYMYNIYVYETNSCVTFNPITSNYTPKVEIVLLLSSCAVDRPAVFELLHCKQTTCCMLLQPCPLDLTYISLQK